MKKVTFIIGESGCGKTTLQETLMSRYPNTYTRIMSSTTRKRRSFEKDGVDYEFLKKKDWPAKYMLQQFEFGGNMYGTKTTQYTQEQDIGLHVCTPEGVMDTVRAMPISVAMCYEIVFIVASERLLKRHGICPDRVARGKISDNFMERYWKNEFDGIPVNFVPWSVVNFKLAEKVHRRIA